MFCPKVDSASTFVAGRRTNTIRHRNAHTRTHTHTTRTQHARTHTHKLTDTNHTQTHTLFQTVCTHTYCTHTRTHPVSLSETRFKMSGLFLSPQPTTWTPRCPPGCPSSTSQGSTTGTSTGLCCVSISSHPVQDTGWCCVVVHHSNSAVSCVPKLKD